jgi:coenzyme F420-reducing hydrogenase gamma subunit
VTVARGEPCMGPVTHAGCGALCPAFSRGCYGCFGAKENPNTVSLARLMRSAGRDAREVKRAFSSFTAGDPAFASEAKRHDR